MKFNLGKYFRKARSAPAPPTEKTHEIVVSSNCQTGGLSAALKCFFPNRDIGVQPFPKSGDIDAAKRFLTTLQGARVWITSGRMELRGALPIEIIKIPELNFDAFHPDIRSVVKVSTNSLTLPHNNSQIAIWAFNNHVAKPDAAKLFNRAVYRSLGYFDRWAHSVAALRSGFAEAGIGSDEFNGFFLRVKRMGQFMYTLNHPRIGALIELARIVARRLGASAEMLESEIVVPDALTYAIWPLYPEVGEELGLKGDFHWRIRQADVYVDIHGLEPYLDFAYERFADQEIRPADVKCMSPTSNLDAILRGHLSSL